MQLAEVPEAEFEEALAEPHVALQQTVRHAADCTLDLGNVTAGASRLLPKGNQQVADDDEGDERLEDLPTLRSQRRFLEVMSLVCAVYYWFDIRINTESSLLGQSVHVGSTRYTLTALWIGLLWAAWRYGQQLYRAWRDMSRGLHRDFDLELSRLANAVVRRYLSRMPLAERRAFGEERGGPYFRGAR